MYVDNIPSLTKPNNPRGVNAIQRKILKKYLSEGLLYGSPDGIDNLEYEEAALMINNIFLSKRGDDDGEEERRN
jgi:hypothetical protein